MAVFIDCQCNKCKQFVQLIYDENLEIVRGYTCTKCGEELTSVQVERVRHACDTLISLKQNIQKFRIGEINLIG